ncbi:hypothetical protein [Aurantivibrio plasticivorans]
MSVQFYFLFQAFQVTISDDATNGSFSGPITAVYPILLYKLTELMFQLSAGITAPVAQNGKQSCRLAD